MKVKIVMALVIAFIFLSSVSVVSAAPDKTYADSLKELKDKKVIEDVKKTASEKAKFTHAVNDKVKTDKKSNITVSIEKDKLKFKSNAGKHEVQNLQVAYDLIAPYIIDGAVRVEHKTDSGITDAVWIQKVKNDNGYVYFDNMPFSEIIIGGYTGTYTKTGIMTYNTSNIFNLGSTFRVNSTNFLNAAVTPSYEEDSPYDIPTDGLVAWYKFDEGNGTVVNDSSGNGNHGNASGGMTWTNGKYNSAGRFDGANDHVTIPTGLVANASELTVIAFVNKTAYKEYGSFVSDWHSDLKKACFILGYEDPEGTVKFYISTTSTSISTSQTGFTDGWHMIAGQFSNSQNFLKVWVDLESTSVATSAVQLGPGGTYPSIGRHDSDFRCNATIDQVLIYNRTLSPEEIKQIYYDSIRDLQLKTNSNAGYSSEIDEYSEYINIPYDDTDADITSIIASVPETVTIGGVTVRDYNKTITPFTLTAAVGYTENTTLVSESIANGVYHLNMSHMPAVNSTGNLSYTTAELNSYGGLGNIQLDSDDSEAMVSSWNITNFEIQTGSLTAGQTYEYNISVSVYNVPVAEFEAANTIGYHTITTEFTDLSTNSPTSWLWDFGDGSTSTSQNPTHTYNAGGYYTVTLTATNPAGNDVETKTDVIHVIPPVQDTIEPSFVDSWRDTLSLVGAIIIVTLAGSAIMVFKGRKSMLDVGYDMQGIVLVLVLMVIGAIIFGQF